MTVISQRVEGAARNNAIWCDIVFKAHSCPGEFQETIWLNRFGAPRLYPDAVTLVGAGASQQQVKVISALVEAGRTDGWSVKDSFRSLDLSPLGFQPLFDAEWIGFDPGPLHVPAIPFGYSWVDVRSAADLVVWETAWRGNDDVAACGSNDRTFLPSLLSNRQIHFVAIKFDDRIVGGGILNHGGGVVGVSNVFSSGVEMEIIWRSLAARAGTAFSELSLVGYESGTALSAAVHAGFKTLGPLRVWILVRDSLMAK